jgi:hypothetical protein
MTKSDNLRHVLNVLKANIEIYEELLKMIDDRDPLIFSEDLEDTILTAITVNARLKKVLLTQNN